MQADWPACSWSSPTPQSPPGRRQPALRVHFVHNALAQVPKGSAEMLAAAVRISLAQSDAAHVMSSWLSSCR
jgi:hypothetical protein